MTKTDVNLSARGLRAPASPIRRLVPYADAAKKEGAHVFHLNIGQPDIETPAEMLQAYRDFTGPVLAYGPSAGIPEFRQAVADYWKHFDVNLSPDEIIATTGGSEAILFAMLAVCDPGDEILVPEPFYTNYLGFAEAASVKIVPLPTSVEDGFRLPGRETITAAIGERTKAIMFSNPGNPTGVVYTREEMQRLGDIAAEHGLYLFADEVYREFVYDDAEFISAFHLEGLDDRVIMLDSVSKRFSACGARVGYLATRNKQILDAVLRFGQARLCSPTVDQIASAAAFGAPASYIENVLREYGTRRDVLYEELSKIPGVTTHKPAGAFYTVCKLPVEDAEKFAIWLLTDFRVDGKTVMVAPVSGFYGTPGQGLDEVRIAYVLNCDDLRTSMEILRQGLEAYR
jgi:aspartate aminotransferase